MDFTFPMALTVGAAMIGAQSDTCMLLWQINSSLYTLQLALNTIETIVST